MDNSRVLTKIAQMLIIFGIGFAGSLLWIQYSFTGEYLMSNQKIHILEAPVLLQHDANEPFYLLPAGTTLFFDGSMPEGFDRYAVYVNFKGKLSLKEVEKPNFRAPIWAYQIGKEDLVRLMAAYPLTKDDLSRILKSSKLKRQDLAEMLRDFEE